MDCSAKLSEDQVNRQRWIVFALLALATVFGASRGLAYVNQTIETYSGACSELDGFPGVLQKLSLLGSSINCATKPDGVTCKSFSPCTTNPPSGPGVSGKCAQLFISGKAAGCQCK